MRFVRKNVLAVSLYVALIFDGAIGLYFHRLMATNGAYCLLLPIAVMLIGLFDDMNQKELWLSFGAGIVADFYFLGLVGVYTVSLPLLCWLCQKTARILPENFWTRLVIVLVGTVLLNLYNWLVLNLVGLIKVSFSQLMVDLPLTILWAGIFTCLTYSLWKYLAENYPFMIDLTAYK